ncbi:MAG TPA: MarR family transcriptional regulator [Puia sp.]|nr:MarR family transcriptional regulator [Puia sp.]
MDPVRKERATESTFANSLYFAGGAFQREIEKLAVQCWRPSGLTPSQGILLLHVIDNPDAFPTIICADFRVNASSVTRLADQLEAKGLIQRITYHHLCYLEATEKALTLLAVLSKCENNFRAKCTEALGNWTPAILARSLNRATDKLHASNKK